MISPDVFIYSITFVVNGNEQVVSPGDTLQAVPGDEQEAREITICTGEFSGNGVEICVDFSPVDQMGQELVPEHAGAHMIPITFGFKTISGLIHTWVVGDNWQFISALFKSLAGESY